MKFVWAVLIYSSFCFGFCILGVYAILQNHPTTGGWLIAGGIIAFVFLDVKTSDKKDVNQHKEVDQHKE
jgi:hypothetical protein